MSSLLIMAASIWHLKITMVLEIMIGLYWAESFNLFYLICVMLYIGIFYGWTKFQSQPSSSILNFPVSLSAIIHYISNL